MTIWVVRLGDDLYVRSVNGCNASLFRGTRVRHEGYIQAGGIDRDVTFMEAAPEINEQVDAAYRAKYRPYPASVDAINSPAARTATIKLEPHSTSS